MQCTMLRCVWRRPASKRYSNSALHRSISHVLLRQIREKDEWENTLRPGGKYYFTRYTYGSLSAWHVPLSLLRRNQAALVAFTIPQEWKQGAGLSVVATHVDSPNLKVSLHRSDLIAVPYTLQIRPISKRSKSAYLQVGVETYGGGIWHSWLDRDLSIAGRVVIADKGGNYTSKLIKVDRPILRIPTLAIHCQPSFFYLLRSMIEFRYYFSGQRCKWQF